MPTDKPDTSRPEAGADTDQGRRGRAPDGYTAQPGGKRTPAGSDYGDFVPDRSSHDSTPAQKSETAAEARENKSFDTTHVHSSTMTRKV